MLFGYFCIQHKLSKCNQRICVNMQVCEVTDVLSLTSNSCGCKVTLVATFTRPRSAHLQRYNIVSLKSRHIAVRHDVQFIAAMHIWISNGNYCQQHRFDEREMVTHSHQALTLLCLSVCKHHISEVQQRRKTDYKPVTGHLLYNNVLLWKLHSAPLTH